MKRVLLGLLLLFSLGCSNHRALSQDEAIQVASGHVQTLGISDPIVYSADLKHQGSADVWMVSLYSRGRLFEYSIDPSSAKILSYPKGYGELRNNEDQVVTLPVISQLEDYNISSLQAKDIALKEVAGELIEVLRDIENGRHVWFVAIRANGYTHDFYIDKETGEILVHDRY